MLRNPWYLHKGVDRTRCFIRKNSVRELPRTADEVQDYVTHRELTACEACWLNFGFGVHGCEPAVTALSFALPEDE